MTARESWSWEAPKDYWSPYWGKTDILPNGDRIGTFGTPTKQYNSSIGAVVVEVSPQGNVVRTWTFPKNWGIYRVVEGGQVPNEFWIYPEFESIGEFNPSPLTPVAIIAAAALTISATILIRKRRRSR